MVNNLWGTPPGRPVRGSYEACDFSDKYSFGPREAGSVMEDAALSMIVIAPLAYEIDMFAQQLSYTPGTVGVATAGSYFLVRIALKILVNYLRRRGASLLRDIGAWLWLWIFPQQPMPDELRPPMPVPPIPYTPPKGPLRRLIDRWRNRRRIIRKVVKK